MPRRPNSPWLEQVANATPLPPGEPLLGAVDTDVAVIGAGIAGVATALFLLRDTNERVLLIERDRVAHGATGHNAGQIVSYFERPLCWMVDEYGLGPALAAQRNIDEAWDLLDEMIEHTGIDVTIERFVGHMGMYSLDHVQVHLRNQVYRDAGGLRREPVLVSEDAPYLDRLDHEWAPFYEIVPQRTIQTLLETEEPRYTAILSNRKGCANSALLCVEILRALAQRYPHRFRVAEHSPVRSIDLGHDVAVIEGDGFTVSADRAVLCTNGSTSFTMTSHGEALDTSIAHRVFGTIGYMAGYVDPEATPASAHSYLNGDTIHGGDFYYYVTRRTWEGGTLTCIGGPDASPPIDGRYRVTDPYPDEVLDQLDTFIRPILATPVHEPIGYKYAWHGLMGYTESWVRVIGAEPANPALLYNLGCNGVGLLPSIYGGHRIARIVAGEPIEATIFDPR